MMAIVTLTLTYGTAESTNGTPAFWEPFVSTAAGVGGAITSPNKTITVQFNDSAAGTNTMKIVGTHEQLSNFFRSLQKAINSN